MSKPKTSFVCSACSSISPKWTGQCQDCQAWNTLEEQLPVSAAATTHRYAPLAGVAPVTPLNTVEAEDIVRTPTGMSEFDRVLGGGIVAGSVTLLGGAPGIGKSTLMLQTMEGLHRQGLKAIYNSGEESQAQVALRAKRLGLGKLPLLFQGEIQLERILATVEKEKPDVLIVDSIQTVWSEALTAAPGSISQVKECAAQITRVAKATGMAVLMVGHITKDNALNGPQMLMHIVDVVLMAEGDEHNNFRMVRSLKNRFGALDVGVFAMTETGMKSVSNPSAMFLTGHSNPVPGSCVMATVDGTRPILVEIQALVDSGGPVPRRLAIGLERDRISMLLAILNKHAGLSTISEDVYLNVVGGLRIAEPASDLTVALAIHSSIRNKALPSGLLVFGEVGLAGEVRPAQKGQDRINEAVKLGFSAAIVPKQNAPKKPIPGMTIYPVERIDEAIQVVRNFP